MTVCDLVLFLKCRNVIYLFENLENLILMPESHGRSFMFVYLFLK